MIIEPPDRQLAGQLVLPVIRQNQIDFVELLIPSNGRFNQEDLRVLWETGAELAVWRSARAALARREGDFGRPEQVGRAAILRDWRAVMACALEATALLRQWPTRLDRRSTWLPLGVAGGTEDVLMTEREVERRGHLVEVDGQARVVQSARWVGLRRPLPSAALGALAATVIDLTRTTLTAEEFGEFRAYLHPLSQVATMARPRGGHRDPDPSSWPTGFLSLAASCMAAISELQTSQRGTGVVPLLDTDELYEAWLAVRLRSVMDDRFGPWIAPDSDAIAAWDDDDIRFELWLKPGISREGRVFGQERFQAVVAELLTPDVVLTATRGEETEMMAFDAKAWFRMQAEDVLAQSAKYLYGIRRTDDPDAVPVLAGVELVTCAPAPDVAGANEVRIAVTRSTPTTGIEALAERLSSSLDALVSSLVERERLVSALH